VPNPSGVNCAMKKKLVLALCLAAALAACETPLRSASAREYQCGRHFVETSGAIQVFGAIFYNRTRDNYKEGNPKSEEYVVDAWKSAVDAGHTHIGRILYRKKGVMYYRGEACVEYKEPAE
jgi:hypothetical protein